MIESEVCLLPMVTETSRTLLELYAHYKAGFLPFAGGLLDQPAAFSDAMTVIGGQIARLERERAERGKH